MCKIILAFAGVQIIVHIFKGGSRGILRKGFLSQWTREGGGATKIVIFSESEIEAASVLAWPSFEILHVTSPWTGRIKPFFERVHMGSREGPG